VDQRPATDDLYDAQDEGAAGVERDAHRLRTGLIWTAVLGLLLLAIGLAVPDLRGILDRVAHAHLGWLLLAAALELLSCLGYVATVRLVLHRGPKQPIRWLAWAEMAFGAVVPVGGAGGLALGAWAMRSWGIAWSRITNRSAVIFLLTSAVNVGVLGLAGVASLLGIGTDRGGVWYGLIPAVAGLGALAICFSLPRLPARLRGRALGRVAGWIRDTEAALGTPDWRLLGAVGYLLFDIAVLWACLHAVGTAPPLVALVLGYQIGYLANLVPIPGGLGVLEGGLLGALLLYGLPAAPTAAAVVLYHAIALWVPTLGGTIGFVRLRHSVSDMSAAVQAAKSAAQMAPADQVAAAPLPGEAPVSEDLAA
jgi:uncharacterized membrane protein YbhN (UPF0104 family)